MDPRYRWYRIRLKGPDMNMRDYFFRGMTAKEFATAKRRPQVDAEDYIVKACVLGIENTQEMLAGSFLALYNQIVKVSGVDSETKTFSEAIDWIQSETGALEAAAIAMIPSVTLDLLQNCDPYDYAKYLVMGKFQFETMYGVPVEQAFIQTEKLANNKSVGSTQQPSFNIPGPGEVARNVEQQFTWQRG